MHAACILRPVYDPPKEVSVKVDGYSDQLLDSMHSKLVQNFVTIRRETKLSVENNFLIHLSREVKYIHHAMCIMLWGAFHGSAPSLLLLFLLIALGKGELLESARTFLVEINTN